VTKTLLPEHVCVRTCHRLQVAPGRGSGCLSLPSRFWLLRRFFRLPGFLRGVDGLNEVGRRDAASLHYSRGAASSNAAFRKLVSELHVIYSAEACSRKIASRAASGITGRPFVRGESLVDSRCWRPGPPSPMRAAAGWLDGTVTSTPWICLEALRPLFETQR